jgi:hypothetical protein
MEYECDFDIIAVDFTTTKMMIVIYEPFGHKCKSDKHDTTSRCFHLHA